MASEHRTIPCGMVYRVSHSSMGITGYIYGLTSDTTARAALTGLGDALGL